MKDIKRSAYQDNNMVEQVLERNRARRASISSAANNDSPAVRMVTYVDSNLDTSNLAPRQAKDGETKVGKMVGSLVESVRDGFGAFSHFRMNKVGSEDNSKDRSDQDKATELNSS